MAEDAERDDSGNPTSGKQAVREAVWDELEAGGIARFPFPPHGRIPNVAGADAAAERLAQTREWAAADAIKANPDAPQLPVRRRALQEGKTVYMAVPRLRDPEPFVELDPARLADPDAAATVSGMDDHGEPVGPDEVAPIDLVVSGSVAVGPDGARVGKGEGFADLEFAILTELGLVDEGTPVATTVHERQLRDGDWPVDGHDVPMDLVVTPERIIRPDRADPRKASLDWSQLSADRIAEMPVLEALQSD